MMISLERRNNFKKTGTRSCNFKKILRSVKKQKQFPEDTSRTCYNVEAASRKGFKLAVKFQEDATLQEDVTA